MKKNLSILIIILLTTTCPAQNIIRGTVKDKKNTPIANAKIEVIGSTETSMTDFDGNFSIIVPNKSQKIKVLYVGMRDKTAKIEPEMSITLREENFWNNEPNKYQWLLSPQAVFPQNLRYDNPALGLTIGRVKKWGWYIKGVYRPFPTIQGEFHQSEANHYWTTGNEEIGYYAITLGAIARLNGPIHAYLGAGHSSRLVAWEMAGGDYYKNNDYSYEGFYNEANKVSMGWIADAGVLLRFKSFTINGGAMLYLSPTYFTNYVLNVGLGYCF